MYKNLSFLGKVSAPASSSRGYISPEPRPPSAPRPLGARGAGARGRKVPSGKFNSAGKRQPAEDTILSLNSPKALEILQLCHMLVWGMLSSPEAAASPLSLLHLFIYFYLFFKKFFFSSLCTEFNLGSRIQHF